LAVPQAGYKFDRWSGDASVTTNPLTITMDAAHSLTANFVPSAECAVSFGRSGASVSALGDISRVEINTGAQCPWAVTTDANWLVLSNTTGLGTGVGRSSPLPKGPGQPRPATMQAAPVVAFPVPQPAAGCLFTLSPQTLLADAGAGAFGATVTGPPGCQWTP